jgi:hypothetical protein
MVQKGSHYPVDLAISVVCVIDNYTKVFQKNFACCYTHLQVADAVHA